MRKLGFFISTVSRCKRLFSHPLSEDALVCCCEGVKRKRSKSLGAEIFCEPSVINSALSLTTSSTVLSLIYSISAC